MTETVTPLSETVSQIVRSRTCGCRDFYIAKITQNDATGYVAGTPVKLARAIKAKVDEKWTSEKIYSDDGTEEVINSSAIRERIYFGDDMSGVLLYTGSADKEGSLGGLIELGNIDQLIVLMKDAFQEALVCTNDPECCSVKIL